MPGRHRLLTMNFPFIPNHSEVNMKRRAVFVLGVIATLLVPCLAQQPTRWQALGSGLYTPFPYIYSILPLGNDVYVGGIIFRAGGIEVGNIARWSWQDQRWYALGDGANSNVYAIAPLVRGGDTLVLVGGTFDRVGSVPCEGVAVWNQKTQQWDCLTSSFVGADFKRVNSFYRDGDFLYVCGSYDSINGIPATGLVRYNLQTGEWQPLGYFEQRKSPDTLGPQAIMQVLRIGSKLYAIGWFTHVDSIPAEAIAQYDLVTGKWDSIPGARFFLDAYNAVIPNAMVDVGDSIVIGVELEYIGTTRARGLVVYNTKTQQWSEFEGGVWRDTATSSVKYYAVYALARDDKRLYVGGSFDQAGGVPASNVALYDFTTHQWEALESGTNGRVMSLAVTPERLYVGGGFTMGGAKRVNYIGAWVLDTTLLSAGAASQEVNGFYVAAGRVTYSLRAAGPTRLVLFNLRGEVAAILSDGWQDAGTYTLSLPHVAPGVYVLQLHTLGRRAAVPILVEP